jgi:hypothetical protein
MSLIQLRYMAKREIEKVVFNVVCEDFNRMFVQMFDEGKIDHKVLLEIQTKLREPASTRSYLRYHREKQKQEENNNVKVIEEGEVSSISRHRGQLLKQTVE